MQAPSFSPSVTRENQPVDLFFPECKAGIPTEVINLIFLKLTAYDLSPLKAVSKKWKKIIFGNPAIVNKLNFALICLNRPGNRPVSIIRGCDDFYNFQFNRSRLLGIHCVITSYKEMRCENNMGITCEKCIGYRQSFIKHWAKTDYKLTKDAILKLQVEDYKDKLIAYLIDFAVEISLKETIELIESISSELIKAQTLQNITPSFLNLRQAPLQDVENLIQKIPNETRRSRFLLEVVKKQLSLSRCEAKRIAKQIPDPEIKFCAKLEILKFDAFNDLVKTKSSIQARKKSEFKDRALGVIVEVELLVDLGGAKETAKSITNNYVRDKALLAIIIAEASINVSEAKKTIACFSNGPYQSSENPYRDLAYLNIAKIEALEDQTNAINTADHIGSYPIKRLAYSLMADPNDKFSLEEYEKYLFGFYSMK